MRTLISKKMERDATALASQVAEADEQAMIANLGLWAFASEATIKRGTDALAEAGRVPLFEFIVAEASACLLLDDRLLREALLHKALTIAAADLLDEQDLASFSLPWSYSYARLAEDGEIVGSGPAERDGSHTH
jgi:hypothetical protein